MYCLVIILVTVSVWDSLSILRAEANRQEEKGREWKRVTTGLGPPTKYCTGICIWNVWQSDNLLTLMDRNYCWFIPVIFQIFFYPHAMLLCFHPTLGQTRLRSWGEMAWSILLLWFRGGCHDCIEMMEKGGRSGNINSDRRPTYWSLVPTMV